MSAFLKAGLIGSWFLLSYTCYGQPLGVLPLQYNSSFAGEAGAPRISSNFDLATEPGSSATDYHLYSSYDQFIPAIGSGIGVTMGYDRASHIPGTDYQFSLAVAPKFSIGGKFTLSPSLDLSYRSGRSSNTWPPLPFAPLFRNLKSNSIGSRAALLLNTRKFYVGYSVSLIDHYTSYMKNDTASWSESGRIERFASYLQLGYTLQKNSESNFSFTPQLAFRIGTTENWPYNNGRLIEIVGFHLNFRYKKFIWGINNTGYHVGWQSEKIRLMLSSNLTLTRNEGNLSLRYVFKEEDQ